MNLYVYAGKDTYRLESSLNALLEKNRIDKDHTVTFDASDRRNFRMDRVLMECDTLSLFDEGKKAVIVKNPFFLSSETSEAGKVNKNDSPAVKKRKEKEKAEKDSRLNMLESYLKQPNPGTLLIFECCGFNADTRKADYKLLENYHCEKVVCDSMDEEAFRSYTLKEVNKAGFTLSDDAFQELLARTGTDTLLLHNALVKFDLYGKNNLDLNDVRHLVSLNPEINIFDLTSGFMKKDLGLAMETMNEMISAGYDYMALISLLSKRIRVIYNMRRLYETGMDNEQIAFRMKQKKGYVWYVLKDSKDYTSSQLLRLLKELADMDQGIKQGNIQPSLAFEQFLIRNGKR